MTSRSAACAARRAMCLRDTDPVTVPCTALLLSPPIMDSVIVSTSLTPAEQIAGIGHLSSRERVAHGSHRREGCRVCQGFVSPLRMRVFRINQRRSPSMLDEVHGLARTDDQNARYLGGRPRDRIRASHLSSVDCWG